MNRYLKYGLYALAGFFALIAVAIGVVAATVNPNDYKPFIIKLVQEKKHRTLKLEGDIKFAFFPKLGADLGKASLSERDSEREFASVGSARLYLSLFPLLKKQLVVDQIRIEGLRAALVRYPDGGTNFDDLLKKEEPSEKFKFDIDSIKVSDSVLTMDDQKGKHKLALSGLELKTGRIAEGAPSSVDLGCRLQADGADIRLDLASGFLLDLTRRHYRLDGLKASVSGKSGGNALEAKLEAPKIDITPDRAQGEKISLDAKLTRADGNFHAVLTLPGVEGTAAALRIGEMRLELDGKQGESTIRGHLATPVNGNLETQRFEFPKLTTSLTVGNPKFPGGKLSADLSGNGVLDLAKQNAAFALNGRFDESSVQAKLGLAAFAPPAYTFDVAIDRLNLDRYLAPKPKNAPEQPLDLSALKALNASGSLRIGTLQVSNIKASNVRLEATADDGRVQVNPLSASLYQGSLNGSLAVNARGTPALSVRQKLSGVSIAPLLKDAADKDLLEGRGNLNLDVTASGTTIGAMKKTLNGSAAVNLRDGAVKGINLAETLRSAKARLGTLQGQQTVSSSAAEKTYFSELSASFRIASGVAHNDDLNAKSPLLRLAGNGDINLGAGAMDYLAQATVVGTLEGQEGRELAALKGVTIPVRIRGPFDRLAYTLDFAGIAEGAVKAKVEEKKEEIRGKAQEELKKGLQDLFKR